MTIDFNTVTVQLFKQFTMRYKGKTLFSKEAMPLRRSVLLAYLIIHRDQVSSVSALSELFCSHSKKPEGALRNLIYRIRQALSDIWPEDTFILSRPGGYQWNPAIPLQVDTQTFDALYRRFKLSEDIDGRIDLGLKLMELYAGDFNKLAQSRYEWVRQRSVYFRLAMTEMLKVLANDLAARQHRADLESIALSAISNAYIDESLHQAIIRALLSCRLFPQAVSYCQWLIDFFRHTLEIEPSPDTFKLQAEVIAAASPSAAPAYHHSLETIMAKLDAASENSALYCEYPVFKKIYTVVSNADQVPTSFFYLILITLKDASYFNNGQNCHAAMMVVKARLSHILCEDTVYTQCADNQFLILLPVQRPEKAEQLARRLCSHLDLDLGQTAYTLESQPLSRCNPLPPPHILIRDSLLSAKYYLRFCNFFCFLKFFSVFLINVIFL